MRFWRRRRYERFTAELDYARRTIDLMGLVWTEQNALRDVNIAAAATGWRPTGRVLGMTWAVGETMPDPGDDRLRLTVVLKVERA